MSFKSSGRSPLFRHVQRLLARARFARRHPELESYFNEWSDASRSGLNGRSRREFLKGAAALGLLLPLAPGLRGMVPQDAKPESPKPSSSPVVIVGGGVAGLTAAYRLNKAGIACEIYEAADRTGGRMYTRQNFNDEKMFVELGAELVDSNHTALIDLAGELNLEIENLIDGDQGQEYFYFGGKHYDHHAIVEGFKPLAAKLAADQEGLEVEVDGSSDWSDAARALDKMNLREYLMSKKEGVDEWVLKMIDVAYSGEYGRDAAEQSALNLLTYIDPDTSEGFKIFGESDESKRVKGGNQMLPDALKTAITDKVKIHFGHRLVKITDDKKEITLTFSGGGGRTKEVKAARVISAVPFTMLRQVEGIQALGLSPEKLAAVMNLGYGTNMKVMYGFTERWWRNKGTGLKESNGSVYSDLPSMQFWETSRKQAGSSGILTNYLGGPAGLRALTQERLNATLDDLNILFPGIKEKKDKNYASWSWPTYEYTKGSYTCPLVGQMTTIVGATGGDELEGRLLFAGEHTSEDFSGFMNGAVESGERCAKTIIK